MIVAINIYHSFSKKWHIKMEQYIDIFYGPKVNPLFIRAQRKVINKHRESIFSQSSDEAKNAIIESLWLQEYSATLCYNESKKCWDRIFFNDLNKQMIFMLSN